MHGSSAADVYLQGSRRAGRGHGRRPCGRGGAAAAAVLVPAPAVPDAAAVLAQLMGRQGLRGHSTAWHRRSCCCRRKAGAPPPVLGLQVPQHGRVGAPCIAQPVVGVHPHPTMSMQLVWLPVRHRGLGRELRVAGRWRGARAAAGASAPRPAPRGGCRAALGHAGSRPPCPLSLLEGGLAGCECVEHGPAIDRGPWRARSNFTVHSVVDARPCSPHMS